jgi:hypothetical protein
VSARRASVSRSTSRIRSASTGRSSSTGSTAHTVSGARAGTASTSPGSTCRARRRACSNRKSISAAYDLQFLNARYSYSFYQDDRVDLAGSLGLHITDVGLAVDAAGFGTRGDALTAPLPVIGARLDVAITPKWYMRSHAQGLWVKFGNIEGRIADLLLAAEYRGWEKFAIGGGVNSVRLFVESHDWGGFNGRIESNFVGLMLYGKVLF